MGKLIKYAFYIGIALWLFSRIGSCFGGDDSYSDDNYENNNNNNYYEDDYYSVVCYLEDGTGMTQDYSGYSINSVSVPSRYGYTFEGMFSERTGGSMFFDSYGQNCIVIDRNVTLYAQWTPLTVSFNFDAGEGELEYSESAFSVDYGSTVSKFPIPKKQGYAFVGWADAEGNLYSNADSVISDKQNVTIDKYTSMSEFNVTLYAVYEMAKHTVTFNYNDGSFRTVEAKVEHGQIVPAELYPTEDTGTRRIVAWSATLGGTQSFIGAVTQDITLYAIWAEYKVVTLNDSMGGSKTVEIIKNQPFNLSSYTEINRPGYNLDGWYTSPSYSGNPVTEIHYGAANANYYAKWTRATYTLTFDANSAGQMFQPITYQMGDVIELPILSKQDYIFLGWHSSDDEAPFKFLPVDFYGNHTLYACFTSAICTVTLDANGGAVNPETVQVRYGEDFKLPVTSKTGHTFLGWFSADYSGATQYTDAEGNSLLPYNVFQGNAVMVARYEPHLYTVTFNSNGGTPIGSIQIQYGGNLWFPENPTKAGVYFSGWFNESLKKAYTTDTVVTSDMTLYARWSDVDMNSAYESVNFTGILDGAFEYNGNYYKVIPVAMSWEQAKYYCEALGGHLATITSKEEDTFVYGLCAGYSGQSFFLGASDSDLEGVWKWITGEPWSFSNFHPQEPNGGTNSNYLNYYKNHGGLWDDLDNGATAYFICEWEADSIDYVRETFAYGQSSNILYQYGFYYNGHYYKAYAYEMDYDKAAEYCERLGGHLAIIDSKEENDALWAFTKEAGINCNLGATDRVTEGVWIWVNGDLVTETYWDVNQPDNASNEDFLHFYNNGGSWNDSTWKNYFLCEWDYWELP